MTRSSGGPLSIRRAIVAAIALILSAAATICVAWSVAYWPRPFLAEGETYWTSPRGPAWLYQCHERWGATNLNGLPVSAWAVVPTHTIQTRTPPTWSQMSARNDADGAIIRLEETAYGWPMRCLMVREVDATGRFPTMTGGLITKKRSSSPSSWGRPIILPVNVIWCGLAIDTLVNLIWVWPMAMLLMLTPRWIMLLRSRFRRRRGCCPQCGYDLKGAFDVGCPECAWNRPIEPAQPAK